jgi:hypothetical protein
MAPGAGQLGSRREGRHTRERRNTDPLILAFVLGACVGLFGFLVLDGLKPTDYLGPAVAVAGACLPLAMWAIASWELLIFAVFRRGRPTYDVLPWVPPKFPIRARFLPLNWLDQRWARIARLWPAPLMIIGLVLGHWLWV